MQLNTGSECCVVQMIQMIQLPPGNMGYAIHTSPSAREHLEHGEVGIGDLSDRWKLAMPRYVPN